MQNRDSTACSACFSRKSPRRNNDKLPNIPDWDEQVRLAAEKEILGFFITGHPLEKYKDKLDDLQALSIVEIGAMTKSTGKDETIATAGIIGNLRVLKSQARRFLRASHARRYVRLHRHDRFPRGLQAHRR